MTKIWRQALNICILAAGTALLSGQAQSQCTPTGTTNGPDVVVGDITAPTNYLVVGAYDALSLGTYSCNIGNAPLAWNAVTNQHPVIGGALFRLKTVNGAQRFEQVGTSWLDHGVFALSNSLCCTGCIGDPSGMTLGVHCSDPVTSSQNGNQSGLGPRWQVNAHTGVFTYPPPHPAGGNNGRLQVKTSEIELTSTGTRYFGEAMYVTADDATAGDQNNNASYIELSVNGGPADFNFALAGSTQRGQQAIQAWKQSDSAVTLKNIQLANDGLVILGYKTTNLGGGMYHYEYAVYNMNADVAIGSFALPIAAGVTVTNISFHDFDYLAGDGVGGVSQSGTDWPGSVSGGAITWATTPFATNQNANAIRWQGLYNFRFDANASPVQGPITLGTFKNAGSVQVSGDVPGDATTVVAGSDFLYSPDCGCTLKDFSASTIPAGFFGTGSCAFNAAVGFQGAALSGTGIPPGADTIVERLADAPLPNCGSSATVPIEIVALHLVSCQPMTVYFNPSCGVSGTYNVEACLSSINPQPTGTMTISRTHATGGTFTASLPLIPRLTFTRVSGPGLPFIVMDPGPSITLTTPSPQSIYPGTWVYDGSVLGVPTSPGGTVDHDCDGTTPDILFPPSSNFVPGIAYPGSSCSVTGGPPTIEASVEQNTFSKHCFIPVPIPPFNGSFCDCNGHSGPCANNGAIGNGCVNSQYTSGARLTATGTSSVTTDSSTLHATSMANGMSGGTVIFLSGTNAIGPSNFGDGLRCVGGNLSRLGPKAFTNGHSSYPQPGDPSIWTKSGMPGIGAQRFYQAYYRDPHGPCGFGFNISNGYQFVWQM